VTQLLHTFMWCDTTLAYIHVTQLLHTFTWMTCAFMYPLHTFVWLFHTFIWCDACIHSCVNLAFMRLLYTFTWLCIQFMCLLHTFWHLAFMWILHTLMSCNMTLAYIPVTWRLHTFVWMPLASCIYVNDLSIHWCVMITFAYIHVMWHNSCIHLCMWCDVFMCAMWLVHVCDVSESVVQGRMLQYVAVCCSVLQHVAVCCSALQCAAVCCSVLQR